MSQLKKLVKQIVLLLSVFLLLILKVIQPIVKCRLCIVGFHRYGHLALEPEVFLAEEDLGRDESKGSQRVLNIWSLGPKNGQANSYLADKWKREVFALPSWLVSGLHDAGNVVGFLKLPEAKLSIRGQVNALDATSPHLSFSEKEVLHANEELLKLGIDPSKPYVCLVVRDGGHYASKGDAESAGYDMLNFDIDTFVPAAEYLVGEGFQVVRMGAGSEKHFAQLPVGVVDYAHSQHRSEFLDVYIAGTCAFAISTQTGPDAVCMLFRRPVFYIDVTRFSQFFFGMKAATWAPVRLMKDDRVLHLSETINSDIAWFKDPNDFEANGISQHKSSPDALLRLVRSYVDCLRGIEEFTDQYSRRVGQGLGERGKLQFGRISARSVPRTAEILGEWVNN
jgi:putative glycosyltransferase (TIGR04372 family)